ncbi:PWWP domain-containing DNA repair factor 3B isoform X2 [Stigmatopora nigra]
MTSRCDKPAPDEEVRLSPLNCLGLTKMRGKSKKYQTSRKMDARPSEEGDEQDKTSEAEPVRYTTRAQSRKRSIEAVQSIQLEKRQPTTSCSPAKRRCLKKKTKKSISAFSSEPSQPRMETKEESILHHDLPVDKSDNEERLPSLSLSEDDKSDDEEELPCFLTESQPSSISEGVFVWCKYRHFPIWPALIKRINHKTKKASIVFIDKPYILQKNGFVVDLKSLTPFDFRSAKDVPTDAKKEKYAPLLQWSLDMIWDYIMRLGCNTFSGSFIEYFAHGMSYPVRKKYPQASPENLLINTSVFAKKEHQATLTTEDNDEQRKPIESAKRSLPDGPQAAYNYVDEKFVDHEARHHTVEARLLEENQATSTIEDNDKKQQPITPSRRILPDRTQAAYNRANEKLVDYVVRQRKVEGHLLAVIRGQVQSRWLDRFKKKSKNSFPVVYYLQDSTQIDKVYFYLSNLYERTVKTPPYQPAYDFIQRIPFVFDVLLHEAMTYAIAGLDNVSLTKAEAKYLKGRSLSNRECQEHSLMFEKQWMSKSNTDTALSSLEQDG